MTEEVPSPVVVGILDADFLDEIVGVVSISVEDAGEEADEFRFLHLGRFLVEVGRHERGEGETLQLLVVLFLQQRLTDLRDRRCWDTKAVDKVDSKPSVL